MTPQQLAALDFIRREITEFGRAPTIREIAAHLDHIGPGAAHEIVEALVRQGKLRRSAAKVRNLELPDVPDLRLADSQALRAELARRGDEIEVMKRRGPIPERHWPTCAVDGCGSAVRYGHLMCLRHWRAVSHPVRDKVLRAHSRGDLATYQHLLTVARDEAVRA